MKKVKFTITEPVFKTSTLCLWGCSHGELGKETARRGVKDFDADYFKYANGSALFFNDEKDRQVFRCLWLRNFSRTPESIGAATHEIHHLVARICEFKGIPTTVEDNADETSAYLEDFYMRQFIGKLFNKKPDW